MSSFKRRICLTNKLKYAESLLLSVFFRLFNIYYIYLIYILIYRESYFFESPSYLLMFALRKINYKELT